MAEKVLRSVTLSAMSRSRKSSDLQCTVSKLESVNLVDLRCRLDDDRCFEVLRLDEDRCFEDDEDDP